MTFSQETLTSLLNLVESHFGDAQTLELIRKLGGHPTKKDSGEPPDLHPSHPSSRTIVVGAGVAGLVLAYELNQRGANVELWEASSRVGGRNLTVRPGETIKEEGHPDQICKLPQGAYLNAGPGRISHHHRAVLHYCRCFGLELRPYQTLNRSALVHRFFPRIDQDVIVRNRQLQFDGQGRIGELAAKVGPWLDENSEISEELSDAFEDWLHDNFDVHKNASGEWQYRAGGRQGYEHSRGGIDSPGVVKQPLTLDQILGLRLWYDDPRRSPDVIDEQLSMFELEGGNDGLIQALSNQLQDQLRLNRRLTQLERCSSGGVKLRAVDHCSDEIEVEADRVVLAMQPQAMHGMELDLPAEYLEGLRSIPQRSAVKVGGWMRRRFWEEDLGIYGGISFTNLPNQQIWYPNRDFHNPAGGFLVMAYSALKYGEALGKLKPKQRCELTVELAKRIHPQIEDELNDSTLLTIAWQNVPHIRSPWVAWTPELYQKWFSTVAKPCGSVAFAGDWCSHLPAWQEGAIRSAYSLMPWALS
ncbi:MAG: monoamine oxidase [Cyanobium sp. NAT70]|nr:monoamine oxidase [Cyanobium sp. NAT70]|tara:strand:- start:7556 stop:9142 length:1587 start_codon:yes stop_codon:yes gene_type:complete